MKYKIKEKSSIQGEIKISGSKNATLPLISAALLTKEKVMLYNVPLISDVLNMIRILDSLGIFVSYQYQHQILTIQAKHMKKKVLSAYVGKLRASYYLMGALATRKKTFQICYPGGCNLGQRPINLHLDAFHAYGIKYEEDEEGLHFKTTKRQNTEIHFPVVSVGATINAILVGVKTLGVTHLTNVAIEPEVIDVIECLNQMGANIRFLEERSIEIQGVKKLHGVTYSVMFDRIEAGSYLLLASSLPESKLTLQGVDSTKMASVLEVLSQMGNQFQTIDKAITIVSPKELSNVCVTTGPYPMFPTDLQPQLTTVLLRGMEKSTIIEGIYTKRFSHVEELKKLGARLDKEENQLEIYPSVLHGGDLNVHDLRCGFALIIASVMSKENCTIDQVEYILRGYEDITDKLKKIGIEFVKLS